MRAVVERQTFVYDGENVVLDFHQPAGSSWELDHRYLYGPQPDQLLAQENNTALLAHAERVYWTFTDNLGTVRDLVDNTGALVEPYTYSAFGQLRTGDTSLPRYLYTGREFDADTGLQYNRARWYDSGSGCWLSEDPIGFARSIESSLNDRPRKRLGYRTPREVLSQYAKRRGVAFDF